MRKTTSKIIALLLVALTVFGMASAAGAVQFEGETSDGSWGSGGGTGGEDVDHKYTYFEVLSTTSSQNIVAYRFSYVTGGDKANVLKKSSKDGQDCLEIWIDSDESHNGRIGYSAFAFDDDTNTGFRVEYKSGADGIPVESMFPKLSKRQYVLGEHKGVHMQTVVRTLAGTGCKGSVRYDDKDYFDLDGDGESDLSGKLTNDHTKLKAWCTDDTNAEVIAKCLGKKDGIAGMALGDKIVVEPVFLHGIEVGGKPVWVAMTVTEIAAMATGYYKLPFEDVYHTYRNNALADMNCTGYNSAGNPVVHDGKTVYSLPAGQEVTILAENFVADNSNATQEIEGSVYWHEDTEKEMVYESDRTNNVARISAGTQYDLAIHDIILSKAGSWPQVNDSNIIARLDANGNTVTTDGARILVDDIVYVYHTYTSDTPTDMSVNTYQNGALVGDVFEIRADDGQVTKLVGKLDTSKAGDFSMSGAIYRRGRNNAAGESNTENNLLSIDYTVISYDVALTDIYLYSDANYTTKIDPTKLTYGQTVYVGYAYTNNGSIPVQVDGYNANDTLIANTAIGLGLGVGETKVVRGGSLEVNWIGNSALDGTVRIVQDSNEEPYENLNREPADGTRLLPLRTELDAENRKGNLGNNYKSITLTAYYDVGITKITLRNGIGEILNPLNIPFGEKIYVYHTYHNYSSGPLNVTGYKSDDTAVLHNGSTVYSIPAGGDIEVLAETYTADTNNMSRKLIGSIYKSDDTAKEMTWETDKNNNRMEVVATTEYDLAITNILLMNGSGKIIGQLDKDGNVVTPSGAPLEVYRGEKVLIYHTYTSDTPGTIDASGYVNDKVFLPNGTGSYFTLGGNLTDNTVYVGVLDTSEIGEFTMKGSVYYKHTKSADKESNPHNNVAYITYTVVEGLPWLEAIEPNQAYREGTEVITSFLVHNDTSVIFTPDVGLKVRMWVLDADTRQPVPGEDGKPIVLTQSVSMPANETQLIYYRWTVPTLNNQSKRFIICADFTITSRLNGEWVGEIAENFYRYKSWEITFTPDTQYEADKPDYWTRPSVGDYENASSEWSRWEYINGSFRKVNYGVVFQPGVVSAIPTSKTAYKDTVTGNWNMKSGYGFTIDAANVAVLRLPDCVMPDPEAYTVEQYGYALFPEFEYEEEYQQMCGTATLEPKRLSLG